MYSVLWWWASLEDLRPWLDRSLGSVASVVTYTFVLTCPIMSLRVELWLDEQWNGFVVSMT